ncbi:VWA domain-containing protein [Burkholderiaceae bacterium DAT-1]|nr:VWA domain-containing protein [Burkholderiaceae bacterium DAT-1]
MLIRFFYALRQTGIPVSITELLALLEALSRHTIDMNIESFYVVARAILVKDEKYFDRFDTVFSSYVDGLTDTLDSLVRDLPEDWLSKQIEKLLSEEEKAQLKGLGWQKLMDTLKERLAEQHERHQGGNKWIGTGGTSPFGAWGYNPEGIRIGQNESRHRRAVKVWDQREFQDLDDTRQLDTRNFKMALRRLRQLVRKGEADILDLNGTLHATARNAGLLDLQFTHERHNAVKVLLFLDIGGSMDDHIHICETLFSAARAEFKHLEHFYFHNCVYETVWKDNSRRQSNAMQVNDLLNTFGKDYKLIFVGDAAMSPYEILYPGGSVEHMNEEPGKVWMERLLAHFPHAVWLNPADEQYWDYTQSTEIMRDLMSRRMFAMTPQGIESAMKSLMKS